MSENKVSLVAAEITTGDNTEAGHRSSAGGSQIDALTTGSGANDDR